MPPIIDSDIFYPPGDVSGDIAEIEAALHKHVQVSAGEDFPKNRMTSSLSPRSVQWGSSLKLNFDAAASPSWVGTMLSSPHFAQRYRESNERQKNDILSSFPSLARDYCEDCALSPPPILKKKTRWSSKKELARPIMRTNGYGPKTTPAGQPLSYISSCNEAIWYCSLSSPTLSSTDDESDDSDTATLLNSPQMMESKGGFDRVKVIYYDPKPEKKITGRVCL
jgi:hypothetical protein